jgi:hypothetical protein
MMALADGGACPILRELRTLQCILFETQRRKEEKKTILFAAV